MLLFWLLPVFTSFIISVQFVHSQIPFNSTIEPWGVLCEISFPPDYNTDIIIKSQADADSLSNCTELFANLHIENDSLETITFNGLKSIYSLDITSSPSLTSVIAPSLQNMQQSFTLNDLPKLKDLHFPAFQSTQLISWNNLPLLDDISDWTQNAESTLLTISKTSLKNIHFNITRCNVINITNNNQLEEVNFSVLTDIYTSLQIIGDQTGPPVNLYLDSLKIAGNITLTGISNVTMPLLEQVSTNFTLANNLFTNFSLPGFEFMWGDLTVVNNTFLEFLQLPSLKSTQGLAISGNPLSIIDGFRGLEGAGDMNIQGNYTAVLFPSMGYFDGDVSIQSTYAAFSCDSLDATHERTAKTLPGYSYNCTHTTSSPGNDTNGTNSNTTSKKSNSARIWKPVVGVSIIVVGCLLVYFLILKRQNMKKKTEQRKSRGEEAAKEDMLQPPGHKLSVLSSEEPPAYTEGDVIHKGSDKKF